ncbi:MAG: hypothetical protein J3K34DRAFT_518876 [Monoraphidium minutum]|nr:MAG: hypothetical protein J3K34DRAFT_518876 [Monoraphidium minutum]
MGTLWTRAVEPATSKRGSFSEPELLAAGLDALPLSLEAAAAAAAARPVRAARAAASASAFAREPSAQALLLQLEHNASHLSEALLAPLTGGAGAAGAAAAAAAAAGPLLRGSHGLYSAQAADRLLIQQAVRARREELKAERAALKAERRERREVRLRAAARARRAGGAAAAAAPRGGPAGPGPSSLAAAVVLAAPAAPAAAGAGAAAAPAPAAAPRAAAPAAAAAPPARRSHHRAARGRGHGVASHPAPDAAAGPRRGRPSAAVLAAAAPSAADAPPADLIDGSGRGAMTGYFQEAARAALLTADQERSLCGLVREHLRLERARGAAAAALGRPPSDGEWAAAAGGFESVAAFRAARAAVAGARQLMVQANMRLVVSVAKKYQGMGLGLGDLVNEGVSGLFVGVERFDAGKGFRFSTYAHWWIRQGVTRALTDQGRLVRLPEHIRDLLRRAERASRSLEAAMRRRPSRAEVAAELGVEEGLLDEVYAASAGVRSLEAPIGGDADGGALGDSLEDEGAADGADEALQAGLIEDVGRLLARLPARDAAVVRMRYGLGCAPHKLEEVGAALKVTRERVRQIEATALRALRTNMGGMEAAICEYSDDDGGGGGGGALRLAARTSRGTKKS